MAVCWETAKNAPHSSISVTKSITNAIIHLLISIKLTKDVVQLHRDNLRCFSRAKHPHTATQSLAIINQKPAHGPFHHRFRPTLITKKSSKKKRKNQPGSILHRHALMLIIDNHLQTVSTDFSERKVGKIEGEAYFSWRVQMFDPERARAGRQQISAMRRWRRIVPCVAMLTSEFAAPSNLYNCQITNFKWKNIHYKFCIYFNYFHQLIIII